MTRTRIRPVILAALIFAVAPAAVANAGKKRTVGYKWPADRLVSMDRIDHRSWDALLAKYVDGEGYVNYQAWNASAQDQRLLDQYLAHLSQASPTAKASRAARLAFWINAYNALTVDGILDEYPTSSIRNHTAKLVGYNIWHDLLLQVGQNSYSLDQIEHQVLRKMGDPRIHFAIVCASVGCPRLMNRAYTPEDVDKQLTANAKAFFADRTKFRYDARSGRVEVSPIIEWFGSDFGSTTAEQMAAIAPYLPDAASQQLARSGRASVSYLDYDWGLNDQAKRPKTARR